MTPGQELEKAQAPFQQLHENDVLALALEDLRRVGQLGGHEALITNRYIWVTDGDFETVQADSLALNYISQASSAIRPKFIKDKNGRPVLVRVDLRQFFPELGDLNRAIKTWEEYRFDPRFNLLLTRDTLDFLFGLKEQQRPLAMRGTKREDLKIEGDVVRLVGEHIDPLLIAQLIDLARTQAPVVNSAYFLRRALTVVKDDGVYKTIYGGLYYDFSGVKKGLKKGTDFDNYLDRLGIGNVEQGVTAEQVFDKRRSDQRIAKFRSGVTGKTRAIDIFRNLTGKVTYCQGIVSITHDVKKKNFDIGRNFMLNLIPGIVKDDAREVIAEKANGFHEFTLFNGNGELQESVPDQVAPDTEIPSPYETILEPPIGCIRCHARDRGWRLAPNDVSRLLGGKLDVFGDQGQRDRLRSDVIDRLVGLYKGDAEFKMFPRGRDDYAYAISSGSGIWTKSKDQLDVVELSGKKLADEFRKYWYQPIGAARVLEDLGETPQKGKEKEQLAALLIPSLNVVEDGIIAEDGIIGGVLQGLEVNRPDYALKYAFIANRAQRTRALLKEKEKK